jgi:dihydroorotate dehydrogenase (NAD+) catalytic subunit
MSGVEFLGRKYHSPLWAASGTFGWGVEAWKGGFFPKAFSSFVTKGVSPQNMLGAPHPRIAEINGAGQMLNAIGLQNPGVDYFVKNYLAAYRKKNFPVWVNVFADRVEGFALVTKGIVQDLAKDENFVAGFELNVSCPNVDKGGSEFANDFSVMEKLLKELRSLTKLPLMVKMSPMTALPVDFAKLCLDSGADAISISNTLLGGQFEPEKNRWSLGRKFGGVSGPALKALSLRLIDQVAAKVAIPICGIGGIQSARDVKEYLSAGAKLVQVGTANFANPWIADQILAELS